MEKVYEIKRWDPVIPKGNTLPFPTLCIKPDDDFVEFITKNKFFTASIKNTNLDYDKRSVIACSFSCAFFPNYRPNFFNETGYFVIILFTNWIGYPDQLGTISFNIDKKQKEFEIPMPMYPEYYSNVPDKCKNCKMKSLQLALILIAISVLFCVLICFAAKKQ